MTVRKDVDTDAVFRGFAPLLDPSGYVVFSQFDNREQLSNIYKFVGSSTWRMLNVEDLSTANQASKGKPICPDHGWEMRVSKFKAPKNMPPGENYYCGAKERDGTYCKHGAVVGNGGQIEYYESKK